MNLRSPMLTIVVESEKRCLLRIGSLFFRTLVLVKRIDTLKNQHQ